MTAEPTPLVVETEQERVHRLLRELGGTEEGIAANLLRLGIRGTTECPYRCPLARYLASHGYEDPAVFPSIEGDADNDAQDAHVDFDGVCVRMGPALDRFVMDFDSGLFPELIEVNP